MTPENVNMFRVLQESTCRHGARRKVAARTLNALGYRSGLSCSLNDPERINDMTSELKFVKSVEFVRHKEKEVARLKAQKRKEKKARGKQKQIDRENKKLSDSKSTVKELRTRLGLGETDPILSDHVVQMKGKEIDSVSYLLTGSVFKGRVSQRRDLLYEYILGSEETK